MHRKISILVLYMFGSKLTEFGAVCASACCGMNFLVTYLLGCKSKSTRGRLVLWTVHDDEYVAGDFLP